MNCHGASHNPPTQVITTVMLEDHTDAHWTATPMIHDQILLQDCSMNIGIMGSREQLAMMLDRMQVALATLTTQTEVSANVN